VSVSFVVTLVVVVAMFLVALADTGGVR